MAEPEDSRGDATPHVTHVSRDGRSIKYHGGRVAMGRESTHIDNQHSKRLHVTRELTH